MNKIMSLQHSIYTDIHATIMIWLISEIFREYFTMWWATDTRFLENLLRNHQPSRDCHGVDALDGANAARQRAYECAM